MSKITNTQAAFDNPWSRLQGLMPGGHGGRIEEMEAQGQRELVESAVLPTECDSQDREALEHAGVAFGDAVLGDQLFRSVTLPAGWKLAPTEHSMWSHLLDDKGRVRAKVFYKAAFYDRRANWNATCRYTYELDYSQPHEWRETNERVLIKRDDVTVHTFDVKAERFWGEGRLAAASWLAEHKPDYLNPTAYWDE